MGVSGGMSQRWRAIVIIFTIVAIIGILAWWLEVWEPFMFVGQAMGGAGNWLSEITGGYYPGKNVNDYVVRPIQDWWDGVFCISPGGM